MPRSEAEDYLRGLGEQEQDPTAPERARKLDEAAEPLKEAAAARAREFAEERANQPPPPDADDLKRDVTGDPQTTPSSVPAMSPHEQELYAEVAGSIDEVIAADRGRDKAAAAVREQRYPHRDPNNTTPLIELTSGTPEPMIEESPEDLANYRGARDATQRLIDADRARDEAARGPYEPIPQDTPTDTFLKRIGEKPKGQQPDAPPAEAPRKGWFDWVRKRGSSSPEQNER